MRSLQTLAVLGAVAVALAVLGLLAWVGWAHPAVPAGLGLAALARLAVYASDLETRIERMERAVRDLAAGGLPDEERLEKVKALVVGARADINNLYKDDQKADKRIAELEARFEEFAKSPAPSPEPVLPAYTEDIVDAHFGRVESEIARALATRHDDPDLSAGRLTVKTPRGRGIYLETTVIF